MIINNIYLLVINCYLILSIYTFMAILVASRINRPSSSFKVMKDINEEVENMKKEGNNKSAEFMKNIAKSVLDGKKYIVYMVLLTISLFPIINLILAFFVSKDILNYYKTNKYI